MEPHHTTPHPPLLNTDGLLSLLTPPCNEFLKLNLGALIVALPHILP
jgi:hypothetical protein